MDFNGISICREPDEHHAGVCDGANAGDRYQKVSGSQNEVHPFTVFGGGYKP